MPPKSNAEWKKWGETDPLFGVAAWAGRAVDDPNPWTDREFYETGRADWASFLDQWNQYGVTRGVCVEVGCGAGRLTAPMARSFERVHGVDVSEGMLDRAKPVLEHLAVTLHLTDGATLPLDDHAADAVFSTHVFQHLDTLADAERSWSEMARVLAPGGTMMVHAPTRIWPPGLERLERLYAARRYVGDLRAERRRRNMDRGGRPIMRGNSFLWTRSDRFLRDLGFVDVELRHFRVGSNGGQHDVIFARKP